MSQLFTLSATVQAEIEIKKSRFLGLVIPVNHRAEAMEKLSSLRQQYPDANHHCWALLAGPDSGANDDGEPSGTAGRPMLAVLQHRSLCNVLAVVVRWFGGVKLGSGGLVRAYGQAVSLALENADLQPVIKKTELHLTVPYAMENRVRHWCEKQQVSILAAECAEAVTLVLSLPEAQASAARADISNLCQGQSRFLSDDAQ